MHTLEQPSQNERSLYGNRQTIGSNGLVCESLLISSKIARVLSDYLNPFFTSSITLLLSLYLFANNTEWYHYLVSLLFFLILPILFILYLKKRGIITSLDIPERKTRSIPYFITSFFYLFGFAVLYNFSPASISTSFALIIFLTGFTGWIVSYFYKISVHLLSLSGCVSFVISQSFDLSGIYFFALILLCTILLISVSWARIQLQFHKIHEVISGSLVGVLVSLTIIWLKNL